MAIKKYYFLLFIIPPVFSLLLLFSQKAISQIVTSDSLHTQIDSLKIKNTQYLSISTSDTISYSKYIWSDKRDLSEILNEESGFFGLFQYRGGINSVLYNNSSAIGVFRDGVQVNLPFVSEYDNELFSVNEIDKIEILSNISSQLYGIGNQSKSINIITKDVFNSNPFSQLRYSQDRFNSFDVDFYLALPFSKKYKFDLGLNKHSIDGRYSASGFDSWRGRGRLSYYPSTKANFKFNFNYASVDRGPYSGIRTNIGDFSRDSFIDSVKNASGVIVDSANTTPDYKLLSTNLTADLKLFKDPENISKIYLFYQKYTNDTISKKNQAAGISFTQKLSLIKGVLGSEFNGQYSYIRNSVQALSGSNTVFQTYLKMDLTYRSLYSAGFIKYLKYFQNNYAILGIENSYSLIKNDRIEVKPFVNISGGWWTNYDTPLAGSVYDNGTLNNFAAGHCYFEYGFNLSLLNNKITVKHFNQSFNEFRELFIDNFKNFNLSLEGKTNNMDYYINFDTYKDLYNISYPLRSNITFHDYFFNNHLNLHAGVDFKYFRAKTYKYYNSSGFSSTNTEIIERNNFLVDVFLGARIGHANINLTVANVFNNLVFDQYLLPYDNRGGLFNAVSRFTIVWDFIN